MEIIEQLITELKTQCEKIATDKQRLETQLEQLLSEDQVKNCPDYELFKKIYGTKSGASKLISAAKKQSKPKAELPNPFRPRSDLGTGGKKKQALILKLATAKTAAKSIATTSATTKVVSGSSDDSETIGNKDDSQCSQHSEGPNFDQDLTTKVEVDQININNHNYILYQNKLYNSQTGELVGRLESGVIVVNNEPSTLQDKRLKFFEDVNGVKYYQDRAGVAYNLLPSVELAKAVGEIQEGELFAFA